MNNRNRAFTSIAITLLLLGLSGCYYYDQIDGSGILVDRELAYTDFDSIDIQIDGAAVTITPSAEFGITLTADDNIIDFVTVYPAEGGETLVFGLDRNARYSQVSVNLDIRMPTIANLALDEDAWYYDSSTRMQVTIESGFVLAAPFEIVGRRADLLIEGLSATDVTIGWSYGELTGSILCSDLDLDAWTSSEGVDLAGSVTNLDLGAYSSGDMDLSSLSVTDASVDIRNNADVLLAVSGTITGTIEVGSSLTNDIALSPDTSGLIDDNLLEDV